MFSFLYKTKLKKDDLKGIAKLMYQDVSEDAWDKENLSKRNLDFTDESIRYIDLYVNRLTNPTVGTELLTKHFDHFTNRIGAYIGEVIKNNIQQDFQWYTFESVSHYSSQLDGISNCGSYSVLYAKKQDKAIVPLLVVAEFLEGNSPYPNLLSYVEEMIRQNS